MVAIMNISNLYSKRTLMLLFCIVSFIVLGTTKVFADTYNVTAVVPYDPPTIAATVGSPTNYTTVNTKNVNITGTCQILNPAVIISVWNGATLLGSTSCLVGGNYSINIELYVGVNVLVIKSSNINGLYGPDSLAFTISYTPDAPPAPDPTPGETPAPSVPSEPANNPATSGELLITSTQPFGIMDEKNFVSFTLQVSGGSYPYILNINWGDGTTMTQKLDNEGDFTFTHIYETAGTYNVLALLTDVKGFSRTFNWAVTVSTQSLNYDENTVPVNTVEKSNFKPYIYFMVVLVTLFVAYLAFLGGRYYQSVQQNKNSKIPSPKKAKKK